MVAGDRVKVVDAFGSVLLRKIVAVSGSIVHVCSDDEWQLALCEKREPNSIGFRLWDVVNEGRKRKIRFASPASFEAKAGEDERDKRLSNPQEARAYNP